MRKLNGLIGALLRANKPKQQEEAIGMLKSGVEWYANKRAVEVLENIINNTHLYSDIHTAIISKIDELKE